MNKKGFTLVELLAVIVILGLVLVVTVPNVIDIYENSKLKTEKIFVGKIEEAIDDYVKINSSEIVYSETFKGTKKDYDHPNSNLTYNDYPVTVSKGNITFANIITSGIIEQNDFINAGNGKVSCNKNAEIEVYRDSDFVYCYKLKKENIECMSNKYEADTNGYIINTCLWEPATK